jgi:FkbM family methyltransferase
MSRRVFLDVGANTGQTLAAVLDLDFDWIVCFEPAPVCWPALERQADHRTRIEKFGLWNRDTEASLYRPGAKGGGLWIKDGSTDSEHAVCSFRRASDWFRDNLAAQDVVWLKLNCEGAECDILDDLLDAGAFANVYAAIIALDVLKIKQLAHRAAEIRARLYRYPFPTVTYGRELLVGSTYREQVHHWLRKTGFTQTKKEGGPG